MPGKEREGEEKGGRKRGGEGRKVRTLPPSIPAYAPAKPVYCII